MTLRVNDEPVATDGKALRFYRVEQVDGPSLLLKPLSQGRSGWASAGDVIRAERALDFFSEKIRINPKDPFSFAMLGLLRAEKNEYDLAIRSYDVAIRLDPRSAQALEAGQARGVPRRSTTRPSPTTMPRSDSIRSTLMPTSDEALLGPQEASSRRPSPTSARRSGSTRFRRRPTTTAVGPGNPRTSMRRRSSTTTWHCGLIPSKPQLHRRRGSCWEAQKSYGKAIADYNEAIQIDPGDAEAYRDRALLLATCPDRGLRDAKRAVLSATKACELTEWKETAAPRYSGCCFRRRRRLRFGGEVADQVKRTRSQRRRAARGRSSAQAFHRGAVHSVSSQSGRACWAWRPGRVASPGRSSRAERVGHGL